MAKAAASALTEGNTKTSVKAPTAAKRPAAPPAPTKKPVAKKVAAPEPAPAKPTRAKKVTTPAVSALFEEPAPTKKPVAKKVAAPEPAPAKKPVVKKVVEPNVAAPVKANGTAKKELLLPPVVEPDDELPASKAGRFIAETQAVDKKVMSKEEMAIDLSWAKLFNAYLKRDLKQATEVVATLTKQLSKK